MRVLDTANGDLLSEEKPLVTIGVLGGGSQFIAEEWLYNSFGQMINHESPSSRLDRYAYHAAGPQAGYLKDVTVDFDGDGTPGGNFGLVTSYAYDAVGNLAQLTDPRGHSSQQMYNQLDQVVRTISSAPFLYEDDIFFDAADRLIRRDVQNVDDQGAIQPNARLSSSFQYDALDRSLGETSEVDLPSCGPSGCSSGYQSYDYQLDGNDHAARHRMGEAVSGNQPANTEHRVHDERDLLFRIIRAQGNPLQSTTERDYDGNGNLVEVREGMELAPRVTRYEYDGYDRKISVTDPEGNETLFHYDAAGNMVSERIEGELVDGESGSNVRLKELSRTYDEINRLVREDVAFFDTETGLPLEDGSATRKTFFNSSSQVIRVERDIGSRAVDTAYDTADRPLRVTDGMGNTREYTYDENSNFRLVTETDVSELGASSQVIVTNATYDSLNRLISVMDNAGNTNQYGYDSRGNRTLLVDAKENRTRWLYDGVGRLIRLEKDLTDTGDGGGTVVGTIATSMVYDDTSRLGHRTDANGHTTTYLHDPLNRVGTVRYADGTEHQFTYDVHGNVTSETDPNGNVITSIYDTLDRLRTKTITRAPNVLGSTFETRKYDGLSRIVYAENDDTLVTWAYDSLSNVTKETQRAGAGPTRTLSAAFDGDGKRISVVYPSGRTVTATYDALRRMKAISEAGPVATYSYIGTHRVERKEYGNGVRESTSYDTVRRLTRTTHERISPLSVIEDRSYTWDPMHNKLSRVDLLPGGAAHTYVYDSLYRLRRSTGPAGTIDYTLDGASNRTSVTGGPDAGAYAMIPTLPEPGDLQTNQYSSTPFDSRLYDRNGNLIDRNSGTVEIAYDYMNRMVRHDGPLGVSAYVYDLLGRRLEGAGRQYYFDGWREIEERDAMGVLIATYVYGEYPDDVLRQERDVNADGTLDLLFHHTDDIHNVMAVTNAAGTPLERYDVDDFGTPRFFEPDGDAIPASAIGNPVLFTGRRYDDESGLYYYRARYLDPRAGRFTTRDPIGCTTDDCNLFTYAKTSPFRWVDPSGLEPKWYSDPAAVTIVSNPSKHLKYDQWDSLKRMKDAFVEGNLPADFDPCIDGGKAASITRGGKVVYGTELKVAVEQAVEFAENADSYFPSYWISDLQFWGHGAPGEMQVGDDWINKDSFNEQGVLAKLKPYLRKDSRVYFRGCSTFREDKGREFAKEAATFFNAKVAGHTVCIPKNLLYPGYQELWPGKEPKWEDPKDDKKVK